MECSPNSVLVNGFVKHAMYFATFANTGHRFHFFEETGKTRFKVRSQIIKCWRVARRVTVAVFYVQDYVEKKAYDYRDDYASDPPH